jgi:hypothetical protein
MLSRFGLALMLSLACCTCVDAAEKETYQLENGEAVTGEFITADKDGLLLKAGDGSYKRTPWSQFTQESLKALSQNPKAKPFVTPLLDELLEEMPRKPAVEFKPGPRLERPPPPSKVGAFFASPLAVFIFLVLYAGNLYAAWEIAIFRNHLGPLACGVSAVLPFIGPIAFLCIPGRPFETEASQQAHESAAEKASDEVAAQLPEQPAVAQPEKAPQPGLPEAVVYKRGHYMLNRRFFETKLAGFLRVVPSDTEKDLVVVIKSSRGEYVGKRISRLTADELHLQTFKGDASEDVSLPFNEISEVQVKHKDA